MPTPGALKMHLGFSSRPTVGIVPATFSYIYSFLIISATSGLSRSDREKITHFSNSFPPFKDAYFKVLYRSEEFPFWTGPNGSPLFLLYWKYDHYLREIGTFITDQGSLLDSDHAIIAGLREFTGKHGLLKCKVVIQSRCISRADTLGI
jgi:hypothetical protein